MRRSVGDEWVLFLIRYYRAVANSQMFSGDVSGRWIRERRFTRRAVALAKAETAELRMAGAQTAAPWLPGRLKLP